MLVRKLRAVLGAAGDGAPVRARADAPLKFLDRLDRYLRGGGGRGNCRWPVENQPHIHYQKGARDVCTG